MHNAINSHMVITCIFFASLSWFISCLFCVLIFSLHKYLSLPYLGYLHRGYIGSRSHRARRPPSSSRRIGRSTMTKVKSWCCRVLASSLRQQCRKLEAHQTCIASVHLHWLSPQRPFLQVDILQRAVRQRSSMFYNFLLCFVSTWLPFVMYFFLGIVTGICMMTS